jgi:hypothetical protein
MYSTPTRVCVTLIEIARYVVAAQPQAAAERLLALLIVVAQTAPVLSVTRWPAPARRGISCRRGPSTGGLSAA